MKKWRGYKLSESPCIIHDTTTSQIPTWYHYNIIIRVPTSVLLHNRSVSKTHHTYIMYCVRHRSRLNDFLSPSWPGAGNAFIFRLPGKDVRILTSWYNRFRGKIWCRRRLPVPEELYNGETRLVGRRLMHRSRPKSVRPTLTSGFISFSSPTMSKKKALTIVCFII